MEILPDNILNEKSNFFKSIVLSVIADGNITTSQLNVANLLLATIEKNPNSIVFSDRGNEYISYLTSPVRRASSPLGRYVRRKLGLDVYNIRDSDLNVFVDAVVARRIIKTDNIDTSNFVTLVKGKEIVEKYKEGFGGETCMTGHKARFTKMYATNPDKVSLLLFTCGKVKARALVWNTDSGKVVLDRIYPNNGFHVSVIQDFAKNRGWLCRFDNRPFGQGNQYDIYGRKHCQLDGNAYCVTLSLKDVHYIPYSDTFAYGRIKDEVLTATNKIEKDCTNYVQLFNTDGHLEFILKNYVCEMCGYFMPRSAIYVSDTESFLCGDCYRKQFKSCSYCGCEINTFNQIRNTDYIFVDNICYCMKCAIKYGHEVPHDHTENLVGVADANF
ncbi:hypothetical protein M0R04_05540 [Candidatus Dojkabacteria bacterium]|jgi:hypothetical protein|nr:hypothetical protein [Candidatus Dojkabacteria bacterium]